MPETITTAAVLRRARELIGSREAWTTKAAARRRDGRPVNPRDQDACRFCSLGAIMRAGIDSGLPEVSSASDRAVFVLGSVMSEMSRTSCAIADFNDHHKHADVLKAFDVAIERESAA